MKLARALRPFPPTVTALILVATLFGAGRAAAEIVVFAGGSFTKITGWEVEGERVRLTLPSGGVVVMPLMRVDRILDDEIADRPPPEEPEFVLSFAVGSPPPEVPFGDLIHAAAERHGLNPALVAAVVRAESAFDAGAISPKGAQGLMQLMPATAERFGLRSGEVFEPASNIEAGTRYLAWLVRRFEGRLAWVLAAYNAGEGTVDRYGGVPPYRETQNFLRRIYGALGLAIGGDLDNKKTRSVDG